MKKILLIILLVIVFFSFSKVLSPSAPINPVDKMQDFVISISKYARKSNPNFIIIPQNGEELAFTKADVSKKINANYLKAIDGFGIEELFYNETYKPNEYRIENLRKLKNQKPVFVSEYVTDDKLIPETIEKNSAEGFISFARNKDNYHYSIIPSKINNENQDNIEKLNQA
ncbi:MAG TPA: endo alpha-1,4 polygalactosaminidase, partial [Flavobacterium sp.]|nr:endo alpha-1,4 polygalactosaminidase [Flavobacterium sp.]